MYYVETLNMNNSIQSQRLLYVPYNVDLKERSRTMRKNATDAERKLWKILKSEELKKLTFSRQKPLGNYIVDFYCSKAQLVIEVDGSGHGEVEQKRYDEERTAYLQGFNLKVLRFWNNEVIKNPEGVYETIIQTIKETPLAPLFLEGNDQN